MFQLRETQSFYEPVCIDIANGDSRGDGRYNQVSSELAVLHHESKNFPMQRKQAHQFDQAVLDLYDDYAHGRLPRREYVKRLAAFAVGGLTVEALEQSLAPNYAWAQQVAVDDPRIKSEKATYDSPKGGGKITGLLAYPSTGNKFPAVLVIHENRA